MAKEKTPAEILGKLYQIQRLKVDDWFIFEPHRARKYVHPDIMSLRGRLGRVRGIDRRSGRIKLQYEDQDAPQDYGLTLADNRKVFRLIGRHIKGMYGGVRWQELSPEQIRELVREARQLQPVETELLRPKRILARRRP